MITVKNRLDILVRGIRASLSLEAAVSRAGAPARPGKKDRRPAVSRKGAGKTKGAAKGGPSGTPAGKPRREAPAATAPAEPGRLSFRCNICGAGSAARVVELDRETPSCGNCGSTVRWRSIVHALSVELFGESLALPDFPARPDITGVGLTDAESYAAPLSRKLGYKNTYLHKEPMLDIAAGDSGLEGTLDFVISSDVFEHVAPPVSRAFENSRKLLKPGGVLIFTVPYGKTGETVEHFPELHDYRVIQRNGGYVLENTTREGEKQVFDDLVFHGGPGTTLEMRRFTEPSLISACKAAGFGEVKVYKAPDFDHGIYWNVDWSLPMAARTS